MLGFIVDKKFTKVYGSVYAIADISYSAAYAFGPVVAGHVVGTYGFTTLNILVAVISLIYCPIIYYLKDMHDYTKYEEPGSEENVLMGDPPTKEYQTYNLTHGAPGINGNAGVAQLPPLANSAGYAPVQAQETTFVNDPAATASANPFTQPQGSNPFRR
jgi:DHA1 family vesicular acetylcholine transporter-like MFS transporter 3